MTEKTKKMNIVKNFGKLFRQKEPSNFEAIPENKRVAYMDVTNVCCIIPKNTFYQNLIVSMFNVTKSKVPMVDYNKDIGNTSKYTSKYLNILLELSKHYDSIKLSVAEDYPLQAETEDFIFILAPSVEN